MKATNRLGALLVISGFSLALVAAYIGMLQLHLDLREYIFYLVFIPGWAIPIIGALLLGTKALYAILGYGTFESFDSVDTAIQLREKASDWPRWIPGIYIVLAIAGTVVGSYFSLSMALIAIRWIFL